MNDFLHHEVLAEEYRRDQIATAKKHNRHAPLSEGKMTLRVYRALSKTGKLIENWGANIQKRYNHLALREECTVLPNAAK